MVNAYLKKTADLIKDSVAILHVHIIIHFSSVFTYNIFNILQCNDFNLGNLIFFNQLKCDFKPHEFDFVCDLTNHALAA